MAEPQRFMKTVHIGLRLILGGLFLWAGSLKVLDPAAFADDIEAYGLLSGNLSVWAAFYLPWLEAACGLALISQHFTRGAAAVLCGLLLVFLAALLQAWWRGIDLQCGCFGKALAPSSYPLAVGRDVLMLLGAGILMKLELSGPESGVSVAAA